MQATRDILVVDELSEDGTCCDNPEADPDAPDVSAENGNDFVSEELCPDRSGW